MANICPVCRGRFRRTPALATLRFVNASRPLFAAAVLAIALSTSCSKPEPPKIVLKEARVTAIGLPGLDVVVKVEATNPNSVTLSVRLVTAKAKLDGKYDFGQVTINHPVTLPANNVPTTFDVPLHMNWTDVQALGVVSAANRAMPYVVEGTVNVGDDRLNVDLPFSIAGTITRDQILQSAVKSVPKIPGLTIP